MELTVLRAKGELIRALFGDNVQRRMWGADRILSSWIAGDSPHARAKATIVTSFQEEPGATVIERDGKSIPVPRYNEGRGDDCVESEVAPPAVLIERPVWPGSGLPPPLMIHREAPPPPRPAVLRRRLPVCRNS